MIWYDMIWYMRWDEIRWYMRWDEIRLDEMSCHVICHAMSYDEMRWDVMWLVRFHIWQHFPIFWCWYTRNCIQAHFAYRHSLKTLTIWWQLIYWVSNLQWLMVCMCPARNSKHAISIYAWFHLWLFHGSICSLYRCHRCTFIVHIGSCHVKFPNLKSQVHAKSDSWRTVSNVIALLLMLRNG